MGNLFTTRRKAGCTLKGDEETRHRTDVDDITDPRTDAVDGSIPHVAEDPLRRLHPESAVQSGTKGALRFASPRATSGGESKKFRIFTTRKS